MAVVAHHREEGLVVLCHRTFLLEVYGERGVGEQGDMFDIRCWRCWW